MKYLFCLLLLPFTLHCYKKLVNDSLRYFAQLTNPDQLSVESNLMKPLLVERVSGTPGNKRVQEFIIQHFQRLDWHVELDSFTDITPCGLKNFTNIIVTQDPKQPTRLLLAAHFDSKYSPNFPFIGATDSAIPCGILMHIAEIFRYKAQNKSLQIVFFDGEEAFKQWGPFDSIYGARHLAESWEASSWNHENKVHTNKLDQIEVLVLLDLLGVANTYIPNYFDETAWLFYKLIDLENRLKRQSLLKSLSEKTGEQLQSFFSPMPIFRGESIDDDHMPFLMRGVNDTAEAIDSSVVENLSTLLCAFIAEYLEIDPIATHNEL